MALQANTEKSLYTIIISNLVAFILGITLAVIITRGIITPVNKVRDAAYAISKGDLGIRIDLDQNDEIGQLAAAFREMINIFKITDSSRSHRPALKANSHKFALPKPEKKLVTAGSKASSTKFGGKNGSGKSKKEIDPESIIPMDESDFGDF